MSTHRPHRKDVCIDCGALRWFYGSRCMPCHRLLQASIDEMAVARLVAGDPPLFVTPAERHAAVAVLVGWGLSNADIARRLRVCQRTVERLRARLETVS